MADGRDYFVDEVIGRYAGQDVAPVSLPAEAPLFLMYTSGTTGRPKGAQHSTGGYMSYVTGTSKYYQDIHPDDVYWCLADIGWITGHSYIVYGPLALGTTTVIYEACRTTPTRAGRGGSRSRWESISSTPHRPRSGCCARSARTSRPSTATTSRA